MRADCPSGFDSRPRHWRNAMHDESKLPAWARERLREARHEAETLRQAHDLLTHYAWYTLGVNTEKRLRLWSLSEEGARHVATVGDGAVMLVGRKRK